MRVVGSNIIRVDKSSWLNMVWMPFNCFYTKDVENGLGVVG
jgi:hypothetical protein